MLLLLFLFRIQVFHVAVVVARLNHLRELAYVFHPRISKTYGATIRRRTPGESR